MKRRKFIQAAAGTSVVAGLAETVCAAPKGIANSPVMELRVELRKRLTDGLVSTAPGWEWNLCRYGRRIRVGRWCWGRRRSFAHRLSLRGEIKLCGFRIRMGCRSRYIRRRVRTESWWASIPQIRADFYVLKYLPRESTIGSE